MLDAVTGSYARSLANLTVIPDAIRLTTADLTQGTLSTISYARPIKLFTANESLMVKRIAVLKDEAFKAILTATIEALRKNLPS